MDIVDRQTGPLRHNVSSSLLADQVHTALRDWIATGKWQPGKRLRIREVAALVGTSEMPVREAFRRLEQAGLLTVEPYKGATVRTLSIDELEQIYDVRIMLEAEAARLGALRSDESVVQEMSHHWKLLQEASDRGDVNAAVAEDEKVLNAVYRRGRNGVLVRLVNELWDASRAYKTLWSTNAIEQGLGAWDHVPRLIEAVRRHDGETAHTIMAQTYADAGATVRGLLAPASTGTKSSSA
jgi:DNA-binding GntR family transcriptional regulator